MGSRWEVCQDMEYYGKVDGKYYWSCACCSVWYNMDVDDSDDPLMGIESDEWADSENSQTVDSPDAAHGVTVTEAPESHRPAIGNSSEDCGSESPTLLPTHEPLAARSELGPPRSLDSDSSATAEAAKEAAAAPYVEDVDANECCHVSTICPRLVPRQSSCPPPASKKRPLPQDPHVWLGPRTPGGPQTQTCPPPRVGPQSPGLSQRSTRPRLVRPTHSRSYKQSLSQASSSPSSMGPVAAASSTPVLARSTPSRAPQTEPSVPLPPTPADSQTDSEAPTPELEPETAAELEPEPFHRFLSQRDSIALARCTALSDWNDWLND